MYQSIKLKKTLPVALDPIPSLSGGGFVAIYLQTDRIKIYGATFHSSKDNKKRAMANGPLELRRQIDLYSFKYQHCKVVLINRFLADGASSAVCYCARRFRVRQNPNSKVSMQMFIKFSPDNLQNYRDEIYSLYVVG